MIRAVVRRSSDALRGASSRTGGREVRFFRAASVLAAIVAGVAVGAPAAAAPAAPSPVVGVESGLAITPARVEQDLPGRSAVTTLTLANRDVVDRQVALDVRGLTHDLDGAPVFTSEPTGMVVEPRSVVVPAGESRNVVVTTAIPSGRPATYGAVLASFAVGDGVRAQVASLFLLRGPRPWTETVAIEDVELHPLGGRRYRVAAVLRDTGDVHVKPTGHIELRVGDDAVASLPLAAQTILPGAARRLTADWTAPPGVPVEEITATVTVDDPPAYRSVPARVVTYDDPTAPGRPANGGPPPPPPTAGSSDGTTATTIVGAEAGGEPTEVEIITKARSVGVEDGEGGGESAVGSGENGTIPVVPAGLALILLLSVSVGLGSRIARR